MVVTNIIVYHAMGKDSVYTKNVVMIVKSVVELMFANMVDYVGNVQNVKVQVFVSINV